MGFNLCKAENDLSKQASLLASLTVASWQLQLEKTLAAVALQGVVAYMLPVEKHLWLGSRILISENCHWSLDCSFLARLLIAWFYGSSKDKTHYILILVANASTGDIYVTTTPCVTCYSNATCYRNAMIAECIWVDISDNESGLLTLQVIVKEFDGLIVSVYCRVNQKSYLLHSLGPIDVETTYSFHSKGSLQMLSISLLTDRQ